MEFDIFMSEALFGSQNVRRILLFLFVNGKCYGTQLHKLLNTPLTPIQKALLRLEKGSIITSYLEGKTRVYQFNQGYPLLTELEALLKKAYTLLTPQEKKLYSFVKPERTLNHKKEDTLHLLLSFWDKLAGVKQLTFNAKTKSKKESGWNGKGRGEVIVTKEGNSMIFHEKGTWKDDGEKEIGFSNTFRWSLDLQAGMISLEHLRRGLGNPVFLFHLAPTGNNTLTSIDSHLCDGDMYFGQIFCDQYGLKLNWRVIGPKKNEEIEYFYS